jgi:hypothetical protein
VAAPSTTCEPRCPAQTALYQIVRDHLETFRAQAASLRDGVGLPRFVEVTALEVAEVLVLRHRGLPNRHRSSMKT